MWGDPRGTTRLQYIHIWMTSISRNVLWFNLLKSYPDIDWRRSRRKILYSDTWQRKYGLYGVYARFSFCSNYKWIYRECSLLHQSWISIYMLWLYFSFMFIDGDRNYFANQDFNQSFQLMMTFDKFENKIRQTFEICNQKATLAQII